MKINLYLVISQKRDYLINREKRQAIPQRNNNQTKGRLLITTTTITTTASRR